MQDLPNAVGVDVLWRKLRFLHRVHPQVAQASVNALPFPDASFDTVISEVIEHIPDEASLLGEYAHEHIMHFDRRGLVARLNAAGYRQLEYQYVGFCELILKGTKGGTT